MKRILVCLTLAAFATVTSLQAAEQSATKDKTPACSAQTQSCCSSSAQTKTSASKCSVPQKVSKVKTDTVKGGALLVQR